MNLTQELIPVTWPETHYVFVEKSGPFKPNASNAWTELHARTTAIAQKNQITGAFAMYKLDPQIYRAGISLSAEPLELPEGVSYTKFTGGPYRKLTLTGPYEDLPEASGRAWDLVRAKSVEMRDDFAIENYLNDPGGTPEGELVTEILFPTAE